MVVVTDCPASAGHHARFLCERNTLHRVAGQDFQTVIMSLKKRVSHCQSRVADRQPVFDRVVRKMASVAQWVVVAVEELVVVPKGLVLA